MRTHLSAALLVLAALAFVATSCASNEPETRKRSAALEAECGDERDTCVDKCKKAAKGDKAAEQTCKTRCVKNYRHCGE